jgi:DNA-binding Lrp family transcriptional regulator
MRCEIITKSKLDKRLDETDIKIIDLMVLNKTNKEISKDLGIPLSTIQRRTRDLISTGYLVSKIQINYQKFGFKTGLVHVYLRDGNIEETARKIQSLYQITGIEIHIGNSDILGHVIYKNGKELLNLISEIKKMQGVDRVVWSERVYQSPLNGNKAVISILNNKKDQ